MQSDSKTFFGLRIADTTAGLVRSQLP